MSDNYAEEKEIYKGMKDETEKAWKILSEQLTSFSAMEAAPALVQKCREHIERLQAQIAVLEEDLEDARSDAEGWESDYNMQRGFSS